MKWKDGALTVSIGGDQAVSGHPLPLMVSDPPSSSRHQHPVVSSRNEAAVLMGCVHSCWGAGARWATRMRSSLFPRHPSTRNWDNDCWETLEQRNFTSDQLFKGVMTAFMQLRVCVQISFSYVCENMRFKGAVIVVVVPPRGLDSLSDCFLFWNRSVISSHKEITCKNHIHLH